MKTLKGSSSYLNNQVRKNLAIAILCLLLFLTLLFFSTLNIFVTLRLNVLQEVGLLISLVPLGLFYFYMRQYHRFRGGWQGEKQVSSLLSKTLSDDYLLINDFYPRGGGDIDHIILGPNGIFVLETKNWSGQITCNGDSWQRLGRSGFKANPSLQVKRNAGRIKHIVDSSGILSSMEVSVEGIVVFTNRHATLRLCNPTVLILQLPQLPNHITAFRSARNLSSQQLTTIAEEILKQKR